MSRRTLPIIERLAGGSPLGRPSRYHYLYMLRDGSGLHAFVEAGSGHVELFAKRKHAPASWHLRRGAYCYEFVTSEAARRAVRAIERAS